MNQNKLSSFKETERKVLMMEKNCSSTLLGLMMSRLKALSYNGLVMVLTMGVILSYGMPADACGVIVPRRTPEIPRDVHLVNLDVKNASLDIKIDDQVARVIVDEVFHNPNNYRIEGTFLLPVERGTAVIDRSRWINGKGTKGELLDRGGAWTTYSEMVRSIKEMVL